jgi:phenylpropionate dioxygenase-like ring-hydroxylating dioxygenase large terminal subunit
MSTQASLSDDPTVVERILSHIDGGTTDLGEASWREPVENYLSPERFAAELRLLRHRPIAFCPSAALAEPGAYLAREAAGTPILAVRGSDGRARAFRNACRHRGAQLVSGSGCRHAFSCRYHGWTYALDGRLRHVPHEHGFPGLEKSTRGLAALETAEAQGVVFVACDAPALPAGALEALPPLLPPGHRLVAENELEMPVNWKLLVESFLEGYHIRSTHAGTFYPVQYDNLNVVERVGPNSRIAYPYRAIEKLRTRPAAERSAEGRLTYVTHLFPTTLVATFPGRILLVALEPLALDRTRQLTWVLSASDERDADAEPARGRGAELIDAGGAEDRDVVCAAQRGLASGANEFLEFGLFESAIVHFHRTLHAALAEAA